MLIAYCFPCGVTEVRLEALSRRTFLILLYCLLKVMERTQRPEWQDAVDQMDLQKEVK